MSITMAIIVGQYGEKSLARCPRIGCSSVRAVSSESWGMTWFAAILLFC